jgi:radical SAM family RiPP maturation amino acid epimerase
MADVGRTKRFIERHMGDRAFRESFGRDPEAAVASVGLRVDVEALRPFWDEAYRAGVAPYSDEDLAHSLSVARYRCFVLEKLAWRERWRTEACVPAHPLHRAWRERQLERCARELGLAKNAAVVHAPFAVELSQGCSIGCWFCGLKAERKTEDFRYTRENARLWRETIDALAELVGAGCAGGFCYWATDPLDNPDYERFCADLADRFGAFPQTTTAQPHKHVERVRALLSLSRERGCTINRFSILTRKILDRVHEAFSPEELVHTELILQQGETYATSLTPAGNARGHDRLERIVATRREETGARFAMEDSGTIACVSGFLLNLVARRVQLVTPCVSSERWPKGYWVVDEARFASGAELRAEMGRMLEEHARTRLGLEDLVAFREDVRLRSDEGRVRLASAHRRTDVSSLPHSREIAALVDEGRWTAGELALLAESRHGVEIADTLTVLHELFRHGLLEEDPTRLGEQRALAAHG